MGFLLKGIYCYIGFLPDDCYVRAGRVCGGSLYAARGEHPHTPAHRFHLTDSTGVCILHRTMKLCQQSEYGLRVSRFSSIRGLQ